MASRSSHAAARTGARSGAQPVGAEVELPIVVSDGRVIAALANRALVVLDLPTGAVRKRMLLPAKPGELAGSEDRVYFGADDGEFYAYRAGSEDPLWVFPIKVNIVGAPVADDRCVYAAFMDNSVRAFRRGSGTSCWSARALTGRPASGPMLTGGQLVIPLTTSDLVVIEARDGKPVRRPTVAAQPSAATLQATRGPDGTSISSEVVPAAVLTSAPQCGAAQGAAVAAAKRTSRARLPVLGSTRRVDRRSADVASSVLHADAALGRRRSAAEVRCAPSSSRTARRQPPHAFLDPLRRRRRERQPHVLVGLIHRRRTRCRPRRSRRGRARSAAAVGVERRR